MKGYLSAIRAITALYTQNIVRLLSLVLGALYLLLMVLVGYLAQAFSAWWWVFAVPITFLLLAGAAALILVWVAARRLQPRHMSHDERRTISAFTEKISRIADQTSTPYPLIVFYIMRDAVLRRESRFIKEVVDDSTSLRSDFDDIRRLFT